MPVDQIIEVISHSIDTMLKGIVIHKIMVAVNSNKFSIQIYKLFFTIGKDRFNFLGDCLDYINGHRIPTHLVSLCVGYLTHSLAH